MRRKLLLLDLALMALLAGAGWRIWQNRATARARERTVMGKVVKPLPPPPISELPPLAPLTAAAYAEVAQKMLFSKDRNPTVIVPPPQVVEKPMPPLPVLRGVIDFGDGPVAFLTVKPGTQDRGFRPGQDVGEFKLVSVNPKEIAFDWEGKHIVKKLEDLMDKTIHEEPTPETPRAAAAPAVPLAPGPAKPGVQLTDQLRACQASDTSPAGTVVDGMKKVVSATPFGNACRWERQ